MRGRLRRELTDTQKSLKELTARVSEVEKLLTAYSQPITINESRLLTLPDHLRKTFVAIAKVGKCDASGISLQTGRARAIESSYLNQLVHAGWLSKHRASRKVVFSVMVKNTKETEQAVCVVRE
jgi:cysteine sulfinate desulfinase/cysteine desulfurase-like protein